MRNIFLVLVSILLLSGVAQAIDFDQSVTAEYAAQNVGRSRTTSNSVVLKVWGADGLGIPGVGVSSSGVIIVYSNYVTGAGYTINTIGTAYDTVGEVVDYINTNFASDSSVKLQASVGADAYRDMSSQQLLAANIVAAGVNKDTAATVSSNHSTIASAGAEAKDGVTYRVKSIESSLPIRTASSGVTLSVYDGNTRVWRKYIPIAGYNSTTALAASPNSVVMPGKGLSITKGCGLCVTAVGDSNIDGDTPAASTDGISIIYDALRN